MSIDAKHAIAHNKVMVIDGQVVITGSVNFTKQAEETAEEYFSLRCDLSRMVFTSTPRR